MSTSSNKDAATNFLRLVVQGKIQEAYDTYISPGFRHHNAHFPSDAASLQKGMQENHDLFPQKTLDIQHVVAEGDLVMTHSRLLFSPDKPQMSVVHIFRFEDGRIVEMWDTGQAVPDELVNELGMF